MKMLTTMLFPEVGCKYGYEGFINLRNFKRKMACLTELEFLLKQCYH